MLTLSIFSSFKESYFGNEYRSLETSDVPFSRLSRYIRLIESAGDYGEFVFGCGEFDYITIEKQSNDNRESYFLLHTTADAAVSQAAFQNLSLPFSESEHNGEYLFETCAGDTPEKTVEVLAAFYNQILLCEVKNLLFSVSLTVKKVS